MADKINPLGSELKELLSEQGWTVVTKTGRELELDELSFLVGACYQLVKIAKAKADKAGKGV